MTMKSSTRQVDGVTIATFDPGARVFRIAAERVTIPARTSELAFNASVLRYLAPGVRAYCCCGICLLDCLGAFGSGP